MGQARRRRHALGALYGTPEGSNRPLIAYQGTDQADLDQKALAQIRTAQATGQPITLIGTEAARPLAEAAGQPWLHEIPAGDPIPQSIAWDPQIAEAGGPLLPSGQGARGIAVLGAGASQWMTAALAGATPRGPVMHQIAQLGLTRGQRERNLQALAGLVSPEALQEVQALLMLGRSDWDRRYPPSPGAAGKAREVMVACIGGLLRIGYMPAHD